MTDPPWIAVDEYIVSRLHSADAALEANLAHSTASGLPEIAVSPVHGKVLFLLARAGGAKKILEIGTLGGYSTTCLAQALPEDGRLISLEYEPKHAQVARENLDRAGVSEKVEIRVGPALEALPNLLAEDAGPFDLVFIDADKPNNAAYFEMALKLTRPGSLIVVDNVVRGETLLDQDSEDQAGRDLVEYLAGETRVDATVLQTVGSKGHDGFAIAVVK